MKESNSNFKKFQKNSTLKKLLLKKNFLKLNSLYSSNALTEYPWFINISYFYLFLLRIIKIKGITKKQNLFLKMTTKQILCNEKKSTYDFPNIFSE